MSESRTSLEQILELLLAEDTEKAEELLHEYVVSKARAEYERVLDEAEEDEFDIDHGDPAGDFEDEITDHDDEIASDEEGESPAEFDLDGDDADDEHDDADTKDEIDDIKQEIEDLRAELEAMISDKEEDADAEADDEDLDLSDDDFEKEMDAGFDAELDQDPKMGSLDDEGEEDLLDSVEYDLDELEEATKFSDKVAEPKGGEADAGASKSPYTQAPKHTNISSQGKPVRAKDGGEGKRDHGSKPSAQNPTSSNIDVDHKKGPAAKDGKGHADGSNKASPLTKAPR